MALPTGTISMSQVNTELGRSATATISLNESAVRSLAGVPSGAISMDNLRGKSAVTFTPDGGTTAGAPVLLESEDTFSASITIDCSEAATWTWTKSGSTFGFASVASGGSAFSITFNLDTEFQYRTTVFNVTAVASGVTRYYQVLLIANGNN